jgi:hypothetical protein
VPHAGGLQATAPYGDDLLSRQPICEAAQAAGGQRLFVCKPASHKTLQQWLDGVDLAKRVVAIKRGKKRFTPTYRWIEAVPLRDGNDAMTVSWLETAIADAAGAGAAVTYRNSFVTDLPIKADNVVEIAGAGRARWKIENGSFNVLKTRVTTSSIILAKAKKMPFMDRSKSRALPGQRPRNVELGVLFNSPLVPPCAPGLTSLTLKSQKRELHGHR